MVPEISEGHFSAQQTPTLSLVCSSYIISTKYVWYECSKQLRWQEKKNWLRLRAETRKRPVTLKWACEKVNFKPRWWHEALRRANGKSLKAKSQEKEVSLPNRSLHKQSNIPTWRLNKTVCSWTLASRWVGWHVLHCSILILTFFKKIYWPYGYRNTNILTFGARRLHFSGVFVSFHAVKTGCLRFSCSCCALQEVTQPWWSICAASRPSGSMLLCLYKSLSHRGFGCVRVSKTKAGLFPE